MASPNDSDEEFEQQLDDVIAATTASLAAEYVHKYMNKRPCRTSILTGQMWVQEILSGHPIRCHEEFRMWRPCFLSFCNVLSQKYKLTPTRKGVSIHEMVGIFMVIVGQGHSNRALRERFQHSGDTIHRMFHRVLRSVMLLAIDIIQPLDPEFSHIPEEIRSSSRYMPFFQHCIGAIDGTHITCHVPSEKVATFVGRKGYPTQNVMAACDFNLTFTYALAGWEGTSHDSRIFSEALSNPTSKFPRPPPGRYYLVDSGYGISDGFMPPYKCQRYHLPHFRDTANIPKNDRKIFNYYHSSLRCAIERTFGVWKKRFAILQNMPTYSFEDQVKIVIATMAVHNFIRRDASGDLEFQQYDNDPDLWPEHLEEEYREEQERRITGRYQEPPVPPPQGSMAAVRDSIKDCLIQANRR